MAAEFAELAKPDSMGDLDEDNTEDEDNENENDENNEADNHEVADNDEGEEKTSLLTDEKKEKSSPSIQLASGHSGDSHTNTQNSSTNIKVISVAKGHLIQFVAGLKIYILFSDWLY